MTEAEARFVEEMGQFLGSVGMTPMAGRMWAWLLICDPPEQTAAGLAEELRASRGAISGTARMLETAGFVKRMRRRGERREYFIAPADGIRVLLENAGAIYRRFLAVTEHGLGVVADLPPPKQARMKEVHEMVSFVAEVMPTIFEQFARDQAARSVASDQRSTASVNPVPATG